MDEEVLTDPELEAILERRLRARDDVAEVRKVYAGADTEAKAAIEKLELEEGHPVRVGRFRVERVAVAGRHVEFDAEATSRLKIGLVD